MLALDQFILELCPRPPVWRDFLDQSIMRTREALRDNATDRYLLADALTVAYRDKSLLPIAGIVALNVIGNNGTVTPRERLITAYHVTEIAIDRCPGDSRKSQGEARLRRSHAENLRQRAGLALFTATNQPHLLEQRHGGHALSSFDVMQSHIRVVAALKPQTPQRALSLLKLGSILADPDQCSMIDPGTIEVAARIVTSQSRIGSPEWAAALASLVRERQKNRLPPVAAPNVIMLPGRARREPANNGGAPV